jgi:hypothetical protein
MTELEASETRAAALAYMRGETEHVAPTAAESAKEATEEKDATLRVNFLLQSNAEWNSEDRAFMAAQLLKGIQNGF